MRQIYQALSLHMHCRSILVNMDTAGLFPPAPGIYAKLLPVALYLTEITMVSILSSEQKKKNKDRKQIHTFQKRFCSFIIYPVEGAVGSA